MNTEETLALMKGQILFEQGDPGGDLYFIENGVIEIYRTEGMKEIRLSTMSVGEVIGIMTCMTNEPRMASARAISETVVKRVNHQNIKSLVGKLPSWMVTVLKDFTLRLSQMNKSYSTSVASIKELKKQQISKIYTASQVACAIGTTSDFLKIEVDEVPSVYLETATETLSQILNRDESEISDIIAIFVDSGMIRTQVDRNKGGKTYTTVKNCKSLKNFSDWTATSELAKTKKLLKATFSNKELRILTALVRFARKLELNIKSKVSLHEKDLIKSMEKTVGQKFNSESVKQAAKLKMIEIEGKGKDTKYSFVPIELSRMITHLGVHKKLSRLQTKEDRDLVNRKGTAA